MHVLALLAVIASTLSAQPAPCDDAAGCRDAALAAAARQEYETFHDLAWRAVQRGRRNDPELMYLLARAQSLSGRPGDALVMLRRLAEMGVATDAATHEDFRNVRSLAGWADVEALMSAVGTPLPESTPAAESAATAAGIPASTPPPAAGPVAAPPTAASGSAPASPARPAAPPGAPEGAPGRAGGPARASARPDTGRTVAPRARGESARRLPASSVDAAGLAYDSASRRFVLGDRRRNRLIVADEVFDQVNDLVGAVTGGFGTLTALAIDSRRGDLWVTSAGGEGRAAIHRLQLVSGRVLSTFDIPHEWQPVAIADLAVDDAGTLLVLDAAGSRLMLQRGGAATFHRVLPLSLKDPRSLALAGATVYVAHEGGLATIDLASGRTRPLQAAEGVMLSGLRRIRPHEGTLVAIQAIPGAGDRLVRIRLARKGPTAVAIDVLDEDAGSTGPALTVSRDAAYYLVQESGVQEIRRVPLK